MLCTRQMELGLERRAAASRAAQRQRARERAQWWFGHMRRVVNMAMEWKPEPGERSEQLFLSTR